MATKVLDSWALIALFNEEPAADIGQMPINIVDVTTFDLVRQAAVFRATKKLSYADCFAAALAKIRRAEFVTGDPEFKTMEDELKIGWLK